MSEKPLALNVVNVNKTYAGGTVALKDVSLEISEGDFFALLGPNGAGKTTLIGIISGLVNKSSGVVEVFGNDIDKSPDLAKTYIGLVPQEMNFNIFERVLDIVVDQGGFYGMPYKQALQNAEHDLKALGLWEKRDSRSMELSGGMKRRLMIARALVHRPRLLILDEPTAGVDVELRRGMWDFLHSLRSSGVTIILTTHYLEEAEQLARNLAIIHKGTIVEQGTMKSVLGKMTAQTVVADLDRQVTEKDVASLKDFSPVLADENTVELTVTKDFTISDAVVLLAEQGIKVVSVRNKTNRLEEHFVRITESVV
jgi:ABC-2 type transport system ATP-binding protein